MMRFTQPRPRRAFHQPPGRENAHRHTEYARVKGTVAQKTDGALLLATDPEKPATWIPLHALEASSRVAVYRAERGDQLEVQVELKMAMEKKLV